ncbi:MAG TPA: Hsp20/alpha crystallin family protein [Candidatus Paceibacterota bacterium]|nr:Hsp20/alpha crystallin family protein [Candidatus Paceibacterota bacterium]
MTSLWQKLTGGVNLEEEEYDEEESGEESGGEFDEDAQLSIDLYQTPNEIILQTMVPGVRPEDLAVEIGRDQVTIRGKREINRAITDDNYFVRELYWGSFSRTISLPAEVDPEEAEAVEKHGLLLIKLPKIDKEKKAIVRVKSV